MFVQFKFFKNHNSFNKELNYDSINYFLRLSYIPSPYSIFKNFKKLKPGSYLKINYSKMKIELYSYWSIERDLDMISYQDTFKEKDYILRCDKILKNNIISRTLSDVPIGAFLSSGIDSSLIASYN